ncbi:MAG: MerR family transcriptional regulator [Hyphomicrobium sp.]|nr:MAG: MerR family transcriptional regulator [Hyphomicrobium sp.]
MSKSIEAFRTIAEVADELGVPKHVLRFWEVKFPQIRPMKRGGGRRYYRPEDLELLKGIRALLHAEAYTIKGVQKILREQGVEQVKQEGRAPLATDGGKRKAQAAVARSASNSETSAVGLPAAKRGGRAAEPVARMAGRLPGIQISAEAKARISAVVAELEACRQLLLSSVPAPRDPSRSDGRSRAGR